MGGMEAILAVTYQNVSIFKDRPTRGAYHNSGGIGLFPSHSYTLRTESQNLPQDAEAPAPPERETVSNQRYTNPEGRYVHLACVGWHELARLLGVLPELPTDEERHS